MRGQSSGRLDPGGIIPSNVASPARGTYPHQGGAMRGYMRPSTRTPSAPANRRPVLRTRAAALRIRRGAA